MHFSPKDDINYTFPVKLIFTKIILNLPSLCVGLLYAAINFMIVFWIMDFFQAFDLFPQLVMNDLRVINAKPVYRLFAQPFVQAQNKENIKAPRPWPLWGESTDDEWIPSQWTSDAKKAFFDVIMEKLFTHVHHHSIELW